MDKKRASRISGIPKLLIPNILIDNDGNEDNRHDGSRSFKPDEGSVVRWTHLSVGESGRGQQAKMTDSTDATQLESPNEHPLSYPRLSVTTGPRLGMVSGFSFELYEPENKGSGSGQGSQRGSVAGPTQARDLLDDSVWMDSILRSTTLQKLEGDTHQYGNLV